MERCCAQKDKNNITLDKDIHCPGAACPGLIRITSPSTNNDDGKLTRCPSLYVHWTDIQGDWGVWRLEYWPNSHVWPSCSGKER